MHANARLTVYGRAELVRRVVVQGRPVAHVVVELNVSRATGVYTAFITIGASVASPRSAASRSVSTKPRNDSPSLRSY